MTRDARFWRNVTIVGLVHVLVLLGLLWWSYTPRRLPKNVVWMDGGAGAATRRQRGKRRRTCRGRNASRPHRWQRPRK